MFLEYNIWMTVIFVCLFVCLFVVVHVFNTDCMVPILLAQKTTFDERKQTCI